MELNYSKLTFPTIQTKLILNLLKNCGLIKAVGIDNLPGRFLKDGASVLAIPMTQICQKQPSRGVVNKMCFENMQPIYRRTPMPKCD